MIPSGIAMKKSSCPGGVTYISTIFFRVSVAVVASVMGEVRGAGRRAALRPRPTEKEPYVYQMDQAQAVAQGHGGRHPYRPEELATQDDGGQGHEGQQEVDADAELEPP